MASTLDFVEFVCEQIQGAGAIRHKKMFGEYMVYCNDKPIILICNDTAFVKIAPATTAILTQHNKQGTPYKGAKSHYILDIDDQSQMLTVARELERVTAVPRKK